eukprot:gene5006-900_t
MDTLLDEFMVSSNARSAEIAALGTNASGWAARQAATAAHVKALLQPPAPSASGVPFNVTGTLHHPSGFTVKKILYQTRPGLYVTGSLWVPDGAEDAAAAGGKRSPAVLLASGHTPLAWRYNGSATCSGPADNCTGPDHTHGGGVPNPHTSFPGNPGGYQLVLWNLVHRGFVCLAFDPIGQGERLEYRGDPAVDGGNAWGTFEHEYLARQLFLNGLSAASFWVHDLVASLDLLAGLPYVDPGNLGVTGCSGGGTQSAYLAAADPRVKAASIACYMSTMPVDYAYVYGGEYDGEQTWPRQSVLSLDKPDLLEVRAPRPTQVLLTTEDNCFPYRGGAAAVAEARPAFEALGGAAPGVGLDVHQAVYHHGWQADNRQAMYEFFQEALAPGSLVDGREWWPSGVGNLTSLFSEQQLQVTSTGQVATAPECGPSLIYHNFTADITANNVARLEAQRAAAKRFVSRIQASAGDVVGYRPPQPGVAAYPGPTPTSTPVTIPGEGRCVLVLEKTPPAHPRAPGGPTGTVLVVGSDPQAALVSALSEAGLSVVELTPCGFGKDNAFPQTYKGMAACPDLARNLNRSVVGIHAADIVRAAEWVRSSGAGLAGPLATVATGQLHSALLHAALASPGSTGAVALVGNQARYADIASSLIYSQRSEWSFIYNVLSHYDLPDLSAALGPLPQLVYGPTDANAKPMSPDGVSSAFNMTKNVYAALGVSNKLTVTPWDATPSGSLKAVTDFIDSLS